MIPESVFLSTIYRDCPCLATDKTGNKIIDMDRPSIWERIFNYSMQQQ